MTILWKNAVIRSMGFRSARSSVSFVSGAVVPAEGLPVSMSLSESDLLDEPVFTGNGLLLLRTPPVGWPLGKTVSVKWKDGSHAGTVLERAVYADNLEGKWESELVVG